MVEQKYWNWPEMCISLIESRLNLPTGNKPKYLYLKQNMLGVEIDFEVLWNLAKIKA